MKWEYEKSFISTYKKKFLKPLFLEFQTLSILIVKGKKKEGSFTRG